MLEFFGLFFSALSSATLLPGTSEVVLSSMAIGSSTIWLLWCVATFGNVLGSCINYWLGKNIAHYRDKAWFPVSEEQTKRAEQLFNRYGVWSLCLAWVPIIGDPLTLIAGLCKLRFWVFVIIVGLSKGARYGFVLLGVVNIERLI